MISPAVLAVINQAHHHQKKVVLVTGVFDLLHQEHVNFLQKAKAAGDFLVVGLECDVRVTQLKGEERPVHTLATRIKNIQALELADVVFALPEQFSKPEDHSALIEAIKPSVLAVSSHTKHLDKKAAILEKVGGTVEVVHQHNPAISTSLLLGKGS